MNGLEEGAVVGIKVDLLSEHFTGKVIKITENFSLVDQSKGYLVPPEHDQYANMPGVGQ